MRKFFGEKIRASAPAVVLAFALFLVPVFFVIFAPAQSGPPGGPEKNPAASEWKPFVPRIDANDSNNGAFIENIDPKQITVNISPAYIDSRPGEDFNVVVSNIGKYSGYYSLQASLPEEAGLFLMDSNSFLLKGGSSKRLSVRIAENALAGGGQVKANLCAARYVGMETGSQSHVVIRTCALVTITG